jgi:hypothetical protein
MPSIPVIMARSDSDSSLSPAMIDLLIALMVLVFISLLLVGALYFIRKIRNGRLAASQNDPESQRHASNHRRLTITAAPYGQRASSIYVYDEKSPMMSNSSSPPLSPENVPEIRITFPDEHDEAGQRKSGRVVVVRVGETSVGLEPVQDEQLPAYEKETGGRFQSLDMDRMGGLKEKEQWS